MAYDAGVKYADIRHADERGCRMTVVPATTPAEEVLALDPACSCPTAEDPGHRLRHQRHPQPAADRIAAVHLVATSCGLAAGGCTSKMKFKATTVPTTRCRTLDSRHVLITSQNHGFG